MSKQGADPAELKALYEERLGSFRRVATAIAGNREDGYDAVQEAFAKALAKSRQYRPGRGPLQAWVWRIVLNEASSAARRRRRSSAERASFAAAVIAGSPPARDTSVREALAHVPKRERLTLFLRYFADLDYREIAEILDVKQGTVGASLNRGRARLVDLLSEGGAG